MVDVTSVKQDGEFCLSKLLLFLKKTELKFLSYDNVESYLSECIVGKIYSYKVKQVY